MVFAEALRSKIASWLRPWMDYEPELELKIGFLSSFGSIKNLSFDSSALNPLIEDSSRLEVKRAKVGELSVRFSPWSSPSIVLDVRGVDVVLAPREMVEIGRSSSPESASRKRKGMIASIDPEGAMLHEIIGRNLFKSSRGNWLMLSLYDLALRSFQIHFQDAQMHIELIDPHACLLDVKKLTLEPHLLHSRSLFGGLVGSLFRTGTKYTLTVDCNSLELGLKEAVQTHCIASLINSSACFSFYNFRPVGYDIHVPLVDVNISPMHIPFLVIIMDIFSVNSFVSQRNGQDLWKLAAKKIYYLIPNASLNLQRLVNMVLLWVRYIHAYELLLLLVGYSGDRMFIENFARVSSDRRLFIRVEHQWNLTYELEEKLPDEAVGRARRIARYRVLTNSCSQDLKSINDVINMSLWKVFTLLLTLWNLILFMSQSVARILSIWSFFKQNQERRAHPLLFPVHSLYDSHLLVHLNLNFGELIINFRPVMVGDAFSNARLKSEFSISRLPSLCLVMKYLCVIRTLGCTEESFFFASGELKLLHSLSSSISAKGTDLGVQRKKSLKGYEEIGDGPRILLHIDSAQPCESTADISGYSVPIESGLGFVLRNSIRDLWLKWSKICRRFEELGVQHTSQPFILCETRSFLIDPYQTRGQYGLWKCSFTLGKLYFDLDHSSVSYTALLLKQLQHYYNWSVTVGRTQCLSCSSTVIGVKTEVNLEYWADIYFSKLKAAMLNVLPDKNIQVGFSIVGPSMQISSDVIENNESSVVPQRNKGYAFTLDIQTIEFVVCPASRAVLAALTGEPSFTETHAEFLWLKEPQLVEMPKPHTNEKFISQGRIALNTCLKFQNVTAFVKPIGANQQFQVIQPTSATIESSICRDSLHSVCGTIYGQSITLNGIITGAAIFLYMDELCSLLQFFEYTFSTAGSLCNNIDPVIVYSQDFIRKWTSLLKKDESGSIAESRAPETTVLPQNENIRVEAAIDLGSLDIILSDSRKNQVSGTSRMVHRASSSGMSNMGMLPTCKDIPTTNIDGFSGSSIGTFIGKCCLQLFWKGRSLKVLFDISRLQSVILSSQTQSGLPLDMLHIKELVLKSPNHLYEVSVSCCTLTLNVGPQGDILMATCGSTGKESFLSSKHRVSLTPERPDLNGEGSNITSSPNDNLSTPQITAGITRLPSDFWVVVGIELGDVLIVEHCIKDLLSGVHRSKRLRLTIVADGFLHTLDCKFQGGYIFLETVALAIFVHCFREYLLLITSSIRRMIGACGQFFLLFSEEIPLGPTSHFGGDSTLAFPASYSEIPEAEGRPQSKLKFLQAINIDVSQFSLALAVRDGCDEARELDLEADLSLNIPSYGEKFSFDVYRLAISTRCLCKDLLHQTSEPAIPHFHAGTMTDLSTSSNSENSSPPSQVTERMSHYQLEAHAGHGTTFQRGIFVRNGAIKSSPFYHHSDILKHVTVSVATEKVNLGGEVALKDMTSCWLGTGSLRGFDLTITLSEIQMVLALVAPLSTISIANYAERSSIQYGSTNSGWTDNLPYTLPDGAIVALQDLHQHMYFAVEVVDHKYRLVGVLHYSLVGEAALFQVRYQKGWMSKDSSFSLISLCAKNDAGEPLRLNFSPGSGFVEISSTDDKGWALWQTLPCKSDLDDIDDVDESCNLPTGKAFHLLNQRNKCSVAFVDGLPEFVKKPGNPFKAKIFNGFSSANDVRRPNRSAYLVGDCFEVNAEGESSSTHGDGSGLQCKCPHIRLIIDKIVFTILHEVSSANDKFPLFQTCFHEINFIGQMLPSKLRIISTFKLTADYFDAQRNIWNKMISPVDWYFYYHSRFKPQGSVNVDQRVPVHCYIRMGQVDISLSELSLDILLYTIGKLNIAGPYSVKSSTIFANCCKLENRSGLNLLCHFSDNQEVMVPGEQSASIFLRSVASTDQLPDAQSFVSVALASNKTFSTSPINISLSKASVVAWKARLISQKDGSSFPGPFLVVEVSKGSEEGLSLVVAPLLRIHNESGFPLELRFHRPQETDADSASVLVKSGDTVDDSVAVFDALDLSGSSKRALMSLSLGNFLLSIRPEISDYVERNEDSFTVSWSENIKGGKAIRVSGIFDKLQYRLRKSFGVESVKSFFSTLCCTLAVEGHNVSNVHFLVQVIGRDVPVRPPNDSSVFEDISSPIALQMQREIFIYPTIQVHNLLQSEIFVLLTEDDPDLGMTDDFNKFGKQAIIPCGSSSYFYVNPDIMYFTITLTSYSSKCKPVHSGDWIKKLNKQKSDVHFLDIELVFGGGKYFACLRLSCSDRGILEATVFTSYTLLNDTDLTLACSTSNQRPLSWAEAEKYGSDFPPELGCLLHPKSTRSWFLKSKKVHLKWLKEGSSELLLDLDMLSGFTELCLEAEHSGVNHVAKLGVSLKPCTHKVFVPSQLVCVVPRCIVSNESNESILVRQCYLEGDLDVITLIEAKQKEALQLRKATSRKSRETGLFDSILRKHRNSNEDSLFFFQFGLKELGYSWSGPICISSLGRFYLKFKSLSNNVGDHSNPSGAKDDKPMQFATLHILEENSSLVLHYYMPANVALPYRIENRLHGVSIMYHQKDLMELDLLHPGNSVDYVWDDLNLPHKLVVHIADAHVSREISIDKVCTWKPFLKMRQNNGLVLHLPFNKRIQAEKRVLSDSSGLEVFKLGYEVYADGLTRVLRICELPGSRKVEKLHLPRANIQFRVSSLATYILENDKQGLDASGLPANSTIVIAKLANITLNSSITNQHRSNCLSIESLSVDEKWQGAPFASMLRMKEQHDSGLNKKALQVIFILDSTVSNVKQVKYFSLILQPIVLKVDEETLMRLAPFWRASLSDSSTQNQQYYFRHFEVYPIKITGSFLPGNASSSYSSTQETLRSLLHSMIKVPAINNKVVELNGVLLTHALVSFRELLIKCAQHYSWYAMRAVYVAKGSPLLPPAFASIFDDTASSSLDVFFDPSDGSINLPGVTLGMFKLISKCINKKGFLGTKRYFGDLGSTIKRAGSKALFAAITEISDNVLKGAEAGGFNGMVTGFHQGILRLAMEPSLLGFAVMEGGPDRKIKLDRNPGVDELYIEGYLQAMLDVVYRQEYLRVRVIDDQVFLKNLPPNSSMINEIVENVKSFLVSRSLLRGDNSTASRPFRQLQSESEWRIGPTVLTLCEHLFVSFTIRILRREANKFLSRISQKPKLKGGDEGEEAASRAEDKPNRKWAVGKFVLSGMIAYLDGQLCRHIPHPIARRIVSGFLLTFLDNKNNE